MQFLFVFWGYSKKYAPLCLFLGKTHKKQANPSRKNSLNQKPYEKLFCHLLLMLFSNGFCKKLDKLSV